MEKAALWKGYKWIKKDHPIDLNSIMNIFQQVKNSARGLRSPASFILIHRGKIEFRSGEIIYILPSGSRRIEKFRDDLIEYLNDSQ